jgi:hypothetical protein
VSARTVSLFGNLEPAGGCGLLLTECLGRGRGGQSPVDLKELVAGGFCGAIDVWDRGRGTGCAPGDVGRDGKTVWRGRKFVTRPDELQRVGADVGAEDPAELTVVLEPTRYAWIVIAEWFPRRGAKVVMVGRPAVRRGDAAVVERTDREGQAVRAAAPAGVLDHRLGHRHVALKTKLCGRLSVVVPQHVVGDFVAACPSEQRACAQQPQFVHHDPGLDRQAG